MHLEELIIEGFKSYVSRTHITGWDREFNAITGLNGSGKSNILDAICFVLGITNLSQVRASNLQDLIYKRGQAGVTKASVTIVFNNQDREKSPVGYEAYNQITVTRQVLMGGKTKYIVNGHNAQQQMVQNLFQSVQLNINNPHFLIMQGRITKVLNMKPVEILSMVEEAAGTKMFEDRKNKAFLTMGKKERKVDEINTILGEEITPKLDHLRAEKRMFLEFQKNESEMERLNRLLIAHEYSRHYERLNKSGADTTARTDKISELKASADIIQNEISNIDQEKETITERMKKESMGGTTIRKLEQELKEHSTQLVRLNTKKTLLESSTLDEQKNLVSLRAQKGEMENNLREKKESYNNVNKEYASFKVTYDEKAEEMNTTSELIQTLTTGVSAEEGHENGYMEQLQKSKNNANKASTAVEQASLKMKHMNKELGEKEQQLKNAQNENQGAMVQLEKKQSEIGELEQQLSALDWNPDHETSLQKERTYVQDTLSNLNEKQDKLSRRLNNLEFQYSNPSPDFDRSKVKGPAVELITLDKERHEAATALEVCAGNRLYNIVVEDEKVGAQLLDKGRLKRRVTLIPLNKIQGKKVSDQKVKLAKNLGKGQVELALDLVGYEDEVYQAMEWIFGSTFICRDAKTAKEVTFHKDIRVKSVTYDGDVYDPQGTLSGGSKPNTSGILVKLQELNEIRADIRHHNEKLEKLEREIRSNQQIVGEYNRLKQRLDLKSHELHLLQQRMSNSTHAQLAARIQSLKEQMEEQENAKQDAKKAEEKAKTECGRIEKEMADFNANKDTKLEEMTKRVSQLKSQLAKSATKMKDMQRTVQTFELEIEQLDVDIENSQNEIDKSSESIKSLKAEMVEIQDETSSNETTSEQLRNQLDKENEILAARNEELTELSDLHEKKSNALVELNLQVQKLTHENEKFAKEQQASQQIVADYEKNNDWIIDQRDSFGQPNTPFDYTQLNIPDARKELKQLRTNHDSMRKKINNRVMNMIDNVEKKETSLKKMLATVHKDKEKIEQTIQSLETYKMEALEKTFRKVNKDFAEIFGDLLAGNTCKLQAPEGKTISEGLEVKVNLGGIWKQSLTELSGGQRSLIALSLILSLLQFKPAPMYILDEVDAALDISHTQNIGSLLRTRFKGSQFLVVSLKDGMFNNANVLFKTRFKDGTSVVERTTPYRTELASRKRSRDKENQRVAA